MANYKQTGSFKFVEALKWNRHVFTVDPRFKFQWRCPLPARRLLNAQPRQTRNRRSQNLAVWATVVGVLQPAN
eukprot:8316783-Alexandrium_andersonii.AAC.1